MMPSQQLTQLGQDEFDAIDVRTAPLKQLITVGCREEAPSAASKEKGGIGWIAITV
jgi:hypothetical protein